MRFALPERTSDWLPTVLVLLVVLLAGGRLIMLSMERNATLGRTDARTVLNEDRRVLEAQLKALAQVATDEASRASRALTADRSRTLASLAPARNAFWMAADGSVARSTTAAAPLAAGVASDWRAETAGTPLASAQSFLSPTRQGSQWIIAARAPVEVRVSPGESQRVGWAVTYVDLDRLFANAHLGELVGKGYDFTLTQPVPANQRARVFVSAGPLPLSATARSVIHTPADFAAGNADYLQLDIRPRDGWYPLSKLATDIGLLALIAWIIAFGTHDLVHRSRRLQVALSQSKRRLVASNERLMKEIEERENLQKSFEHARYHDAFTGLPNRRFFMDQLDRTLRDVRARRRQGVAVVLIDIDRFKLINETLGHTAGDELMVQAARRFEKATVTLDSVLARWGGDQFALLLFDIPAAEAVLSVARSLQETLSEPFEVRRHRLNITAKMGLTFADLGPLRAEDVVREADIALAVAKRPEKPSTIVYTPASLQTR